jgi:Xaa-Pro aminopeptidase
MFPTDTYIKRRQSLKNYLKSGVIFFPGNQESPYNYTSNAYRFRQDSNFLYFWGMDLPNLAAIIDLDSNEEIVFGDDPETSDIVWTGPLPKIKELALKSGVTKTLLFSELNNLIKDYKHKKRPIHFAPPYRGEIKIQMSALLECKIEDLSNLASKELIKAIVKLRSIKDKLEIKEIENMVEVAFLMHTTAMKMARPGATEREIAGVIEGICLSNSYAVSFSSICSIHGEILHNPYYNNVLEKGKLFLADAGSESLMHYASDITRTTPVAKKFDSRQRDIYEIVLNANLEVIRISKPGLLYRDIHLAAAKIIVDGLKSIGLMKGNSDEAVSEGAHAIFFPHGLGHMLGLDVHDMEGLGEDYVGYDSNISRSEQFGLAYLRMARKLEPGFVITDEPGIYFIPSLINQWKVEKQFTEFINYDKLEEYKDFGGIRIEDDLLITENGCKVLGKPIPKTIDEIENL